MFGCSSNRKPNYQWLKVKEINCLLKRELGSYRAVSPAEWCHQGPRSLCLSALSSVCVCWVISFITMAVWVPQLQGSCATAMTKCQGRGSLSLSLSLSLSFSLSISGYIHSIEKFPGQEWNLSHNSDNTTSLTC